MKGFGMGVLRSANRFLDSAKSRRNSSGEIFLLSLPAFAFEKANITHESYMTGQAAFLFTKMFVNNVIETKGAYPPEVLETAERSYFLEEAAKLELTVDMNIINQIK